MSETLKPCPFGCVGGHVLNSRQEVPWIECEVCGAHGPYGSDVEGAKEKWNTRAESAELSRLRAEVEAVRTALIASGEAVGAVLNDHVTSDFLQHVPSEVALVVSRLRREALAAEQALAQAREWRTMESAPKDGTPFLATDGVERVIFIADEDTNDIRAWLGTRAFVPTLWAPLPPLPSEPVNASKDGGAK